MPKELSEIEMQLLKQLGERIRHIRKERGITQIIFAEKANVNDNLIGRIERGERTATFIQLIKIAEVLEVQLTDLLDFTKPISL